MGHETAIRVERQGASAEQLAGGENTPGMLVADNSARAVTLQRFQGLAQNSPRAIQFKQQTDRIAAGPASVTLQRVQQMSANSPRVAQLKRQAEVTTANGEKSAVALKAARYSAARTVQLKTQIQHTHGTAKYRTAEGKVGLEMKAVLDRDDEVKGAGVLDDTPDNEDLYKEVSKHNRKKFARGHLLNHDLGGFGMPENLFPISGAANSFHSKYVENEVKKGLRDSPSDKAISYQVKVFGEPKESQLECTYGQVEKEAGLDDAPETSVTKVIPSKLADADETGDGASAGGSHHYAGAAGWKHKPEKRGTSKARYLELSRDGDSKKIDSAEQDPEVLTDRMNTKSDADPYEPTAEELKDIAAATKEANQANAAEDLAELVSRIMDDGTASADLDTRRKSSRRKHKFDLRKHKRERISRALKTYLTISQMSIALARTSISQTRAMVFKLLSHERKK